MGIPSIANRRIKTEHSTNASHTPRHAKPAFTQLAREAIARKAERQS